MFLNENTRLETTTHISETQLLYLDIFTTDQKVVSDAILDIFYFFVILLINSKLP